jgi:hypothetical protein
MGKKKDDHVCAICGKTFAQRDLVSGALVRDVITNEIVNDHPEWSSDSIICKVDLAAYRAKYVPSLLQSEKGELTVLEHEVPNIIRDHELLAKNVEIELEEKRSYGERLADRIASFGGSWAFLLCMAETRNTEQRARRLEAALVVPEASKNVSG